MSYPFDLLHQRIWPTDTGMAFVLYPFSDSGDRLCENIIRPALDDVGLKFEDAKGTKGAAPLLGEILKGIASAQIVIAVINEDRPNVYWELGVAMTWKPRTQLLTIGEQEEGRLAPLPFDLAGFRHVPLNFSAIAASKLKLTAELKSTLDSHNELLTRSVTSARNQLGPIELKFIYRWGSATHGNLVLPAYQAITESAEYLQPITSDVTVFANEPTKIGPKLLATYMDALALGNLCKMGITFCNTAFEEKDGKPARGYSFYWTALGNHVLKLIGVITEEDRVARLARIPEAGRDWRGADVFMSPLPKY